MGRHLGGVGASNVFCWPFKGRKVVLTVIFYLDFPVLNLRHLPIIDGLLHMLICFQVKNFWKSQSEDTLDPGTYVGRRLSASYTASQDHPCRLFAAVQSDMSYQIAHSRPMILASNQELSVLHCHTSFSKHSVLPDICHWYDPVYIRWVQGKPY